jgi:hypothetical protein
MSRRKAHRLAPVLLIVALAALFAFASSASAETFAGEGTAIQTFEGHPSPEATLVRSSASYETVAGSVSVEITTAAEPQTEPGGEPSRASFLTIIFAAQSEVACVDASPVEALTAGIVLEVVAPYVEPRTAVAALITNFDEAPPVVLGATRTSSGATTTIAVASANLAARRFNCALVLALESGGGTYMSFPLAAVPEPVPAPAPSAAPAPAPSTSPALPVLSIARSKPVKLKVGRSKTVRIKLTNTGATASGPGALRVKAPAGIIVRPERQQVPILAPGGSWTVPVRIELTAKAKKSSIISLTGTAPGLKATGSFVVKLTG